MLTFVGTAWSGIPISLTRPFRYDLNQIPYDSTVEVRTRFKGLDLIDRVLDVLGASVRNSAHGKGHEEGGSAYSKAGSSLRGPPGNS